MDDVFLFLNYRILKHNTNITVRAATKQLETIPKHAPRGLDKHKYMYPQLRNQQEGKVGNDKEMVQ